MCARSEIKIESEEVLFYLPAPTLCIFFCQQDESIPSLEKLLKLLTFCSSIAPTRNEESDLLHQYVFSCSCRRHMQTKFVYSGNFHKVNGRHQWAYWGNSSTQSRELCSDRCGPSTITLWLENCSDLSCAHALRNSAESSKTSPLLMSIWEEQAKGSNVFDRSLEHGYAFW